MHYNIEMYTYVHDLCLQAAVYICIADMYSTYHAPGAVSNVMLLILPATHASSRKCKGVHNYYSWNASVHKCNIKMMLYIQFDLQHMYIQSKGTVLKLY